MTDTDNTATHAAEHAAYLAADGRCLQCRITAREDALATARRRVANAQADVAEHERLLAVERHTLAEHTGNAPRTGTTQVRIWDHDWNLIGPIEEGWRQDDPLTIVLDADHPITQGITAGPATRPPEHITVDHNGHRTTGTLNAFEIRRTPRGNRYLIARFRETH
ncbi:hypothetical protein CH263_13425 [Rhodococcus sp. 06-1059B-a]|nr:hypothetical protein [Rhodococcus sp. 06-1059B-a]OZD65139.1 hypothetical protein CH263_13425 [Rhodococcus sp. 06-1059B-a]